MELFPNRNRIIIVGDVEPVLVTAVQSGDFLRSVCAFFKPRYSKLPCAATLFLVRESVLHEFSGKTGCRAAPFFPDTG